ncbi:hypothetical protein Micbo1qcDRAFT_157595 [Microdochium bolleyi]|uniref:Uncharacterized protein n=1 Tax=Microdochium bolleyi TaxID=196109 RepID=A0A136JEP2_9PEZI|nr:hypothetical protein Micbo1qcDRAFT_157595 [Microdochium bolleyi]
MSPLCVVVLCKWTWSAQNYVNLVWKKSSLLSKNNSPDSEDFWALAFLLRYSSRPAQTVCRYLFPLTERQGCLGGMICNSWYDIAKEPPSSWCRRAGYHKPRHQHLFGIASATTALT